MRLNDWLSLTDAVMVCYGLFFFFLCFLMIETGFTFPFPSGMSMAGVWACHQLRIGSTIQPPFLSTRNENMKTSKKRVSYHHLI